MDMKKAGFVLIVVLVGFISSCTTSPEGYPSKDYLDSLVVDFNTKTDFVLADVQIPTKEGQIDFINEAYFTFEFNKQEWSMLPFVQSDDEEINYLFEKIEGFNLNETVAMEIMFFDRSYYKKR
jgi:hypothetical protein